MKGGKTVLGTILAIIAVVLAILMIIVSVRIDMIANKRKNKFLSDCNDEQRQLIVNYRKAVNVSFKDLFKKSK